MMKIMLLVTDGVGVRNFLYTNFLSLCQDVLLHIWADKSIVEHIGALNNANQVNILPTYESTWQIEALKSAKIDAEMLLNAKRFEKVQYTYYRLRKPNNSLRNVLKNSFNEYLKWGNINERGTRNLKEQYLNKTRKTNYYESCKAFLSQEKPNLIFCTHQRAGNAIAPLLAAKDLGIKTASFIFSWDNLPKGALNVEADYYLVWSDFMKNEMQQYYPYIPKERVIVTGTPQFAPYLDESLYETRSVFCKKYNLDETARIICFSGDDHVTSPYDHHYLADLAEAVTQLNQKSNTKYQIVFRRCPVETSARYQTILDKYTDIIKPIEPAWAKGKTPEAWNTIVAQKEDTALLCNTVKHCDTVFNVGSTMALDFSILHKTSCYFNYNTENADTHFWSVERFYQFIHFQSRGNLDAIYWVNNKAELANIIEKAVTDQDQKVPYARQWHEKIAKHPLQDANQRVWEALKNICAA